MSYTPEALVNEVPSRETTNKLMI